MYPQNLPALSWLSFFEVISSSLSPIFTTWHLDLSTRFYLDFSFSTRFPVENLPPPSPFLMPPPATSLAIPQYQSVYHFNSLRPPSSYPTTMDKSSPYSMFMKVMSSPDWNISCNTISEHEVIVKPLVDMPPHSIVKCNITINPLRTWSTSKSSPVGTIITYIVSVDISLYGSFPT